MSESELRARLHEKGIPFFDNELMSRHTSMGVGGRARIFLQARDRRTLEEVLKIARETGVRFRVMGSGTNLIVGPAGIDELVIAYRGSSSPIEFNGNVVTADGAMLLNKLVQTTAKRGLSGLEFAYGIPGTAGGAVRMNAGAWNRSLKACLKRAVILHEDGTTSVRAADELGLGYRQSLLKPKEIVVSVDFQLKWENPQLIKAAMEEFKLKRLDSQPVGQRSSGCIFRNPNHVPAGKLIEECGLKGAAVGKAAVSEVHANFIVNRGRARAEDVLALIAMVKETVRIQKGVVLVEEVIVW